MSNKNTKNKSVPMEFNTKIGIIEKEYGIRCGVNPDKKLGDFICERGYPSLAKMLQGA